MKRMFGLVFILFASYLLIQVAYNYFSKGYEMNYEIDGYNIYERYISRTSGEDDSYYFEIKAGDYLFEYNTYKNFDKKKELVTHVNIIESDKYKCFYLKFKNDYSSNIRCIKNNIYYNYNDIKGDDPSLDKKVSELDYDITKYTDTASEVKRHEGLFVSQDNLIHGQYMGIVSYKGVYLVNNYSDVKFLYETNIFDKDVVNQKVSIFLDKYYLVADYDQEFTFNKLYLVEILHGEKKEISYHSGISFDSYMMGYVGKKAYLLDCDNKKQYEIDIENKTVIEVGNEKLGIKFYKNGEWEKINVITAINDKPKFINSSEEKEGYERVDIEGGEKTGYKYYFKKNGSKYDVYRSMRSNENLMYIFTTTNITNIVYFNDYVYFQDKDYINCYHDDMGVKKIYHSTEEKLDSTYKFNVSN